MPPLRALHLFSNYKWTGPAEPAHALATGLARRGVEVVFRSSGYTKGDATNHVVERGTALGLAPVVDLDLSKHRKPWRDWRDARRLRPMLDRFDLVHCHMANDTRIARAALRGTRLPWVRSLYETEPERIARFDLTALSHAGRVFVFARGVQRALVEHGIPGERIVSLEATVDLDRFTPGDASVRRHSLGFGPDDFVAGIVARVQPQRRFDLLLDAAERAARECPRVKLVVIGRGSKLEKTAREPARRRGLLDRVVFFPGYFRGADYVEMLRALDVKIFLVPGTDGTARAVREALACGLPVLTTRRGALPELVRDGVTGRVLDETPEAFAQALVSLAQESEARRRMSEAARKDAEARFSLARQVQTVLESYRALLGSAGEGRGVETVR
jgi:glycosyltransferase involved in cell wall biosynthesis